jgi:hypothetical protein
MQVRPENEHGEHDRIDVTNENANKALQIQRQQRNTM